MLSTISAGRSAISSGGVAPCHTNTPSWRLGLSRLGTPEGLACPVADMQNIHSLGLFCDSVKHSVDVGLLAVKHMPQGGVFRRCRTAARMVFKTQNGFLKAAIPFERSLGVFGVLLMEQQRKVSLCADCETNEVCHARLRTCRRILAPAGPFPLARPEGPDGCPRPDQHGRLCPGAAGTPRRPAQWQPPFPYPSALRGARYSWAASKT